MNNQSKLAKKIFYCLRTGNDLVLDKVYPLYIRYIRFIGKENINERLFCQVNTKYIDYKKEKYVKGRNFIEWTEKDEKNLTKNIEDVLLGGSS